MMSWEMMVLLLLSRELEAGFISLELPYRTGFISTRGVRRQARQIKNCGLGRACLGTLCRASITTEFVKLEPTYYIFNALRKGGFFPFILISPRRRHKSSSLYSSDVCSGNFNSILMLLNHKTNRSYPSSPLRPCNISSL